MKFPPISMSGFQSIYHFTVNAHCTHFLPGEPLTANSGAFIFVTQTGFAGIILLLIVFQSTGRRGTFLSEEQICNCAVVPSHNANSIKVKYLSKLSEINIGVNLQIFLQKENAPLLPSHRKNLYLEQSPQIRPTENKRPQTTQLNSNLTGYKNPRIEIQAKFNLSMVPQKERKIIPTIPIDMIGIKGYDKRKSREAET